MKPAEFRAARLGKGWSQTDAARRLGVSQAYLAMLESGQRRLTPDLVRGAIEIYDAEPTAVLPSEPDRDQPTTMLARDLAALGYPSFGHLTPRRWIPKNPADVLLAALVQDDLEARLVEALPWIVLRYWTLDWQWVTREARVRDLQNRLGFVVGLARELAECAGAEHKARALAEVEHGLEPSRLAREDTLCRTSMPEAEQRWLAEHRPPAARHWNLLTDWTVEALRYAA